MGRYPKSSFYVWHYIEADKNWIVVSTKSKHMLLIEEVLDSKGKNIINNLKVGDRFYTL